MVKPSGPRRLSSPHRAWTHGATAAVLLSGAAVYLLERFGSAVGPFGPEPSAFLPVARAVHGATATLFLLVLGSLLPVHIAENWRRGRPAGNAAPLLAAIAALIASGLALYYAAGDGVRAFARAVHLAAGAALPIAAAWHVRRSKALSARTRGFDTRGTV